MTVNEYEEYGSQTRLGGEICLCNLSLQWQPTFSTPFGHAEQPFIFLVTNYGSNISIEWLFDKLLKLCKVWTQESFHE